MVDLTKKKLLDLGFKLINVSPEESGDSEGFFYFCYDLYNGECLLTDGDGDKEFYSVSFLNMPDAGEFWTSEEVFNIIKGIKREDK